MMAHNDSAAADQLDHAACLILGHTGILLRGPSGSGKSTLQRYLCQQAQIRGLFCALVSDDYVNLHAPLAAPGRLLAKAPEETFARQEVYGLGICSLPPSQKCEKLAQIHLVAELKESLQLPRMPSEEQSEINVLGSKLPLLQLPARQSILAADIIFAYLSTQHS